MRLLVVLFLLPLLAGCVAPDSTAPTGAHEPTPAPDAEDAKPEPGAGAAEPRPAGPVPATPVTIDEPTTWHLSAIRTCSEFPCNCGSIELGLVTERAAEMCDAHGRRFAELPVGSGQCPTCWPAKEPSAPYPAGTTVEGVLYVTTDAADVIEHQIWLRDDDGVLGITELGSTPVVGAGGATYEPIPFTLELERSIQGTLVLEAKLDAVVSYFIGYDGDHASHFVLTPS